MIHKLHFSLQEFTKLFNFPSENVFVASIQSDEENQITLIVIDPLKELKLLDIDISQKID